MFIPSQTRPYAIIGPQLTLRRDVPSGAKFDRDFSSIPVHADASDFVPGRADRFQPANTEQASDSERMAIQRQCDCNDDDITAASDQAGD